VTGQPPTRNVWSTYQHSLVSALVHRWSALQIFSAHDQKRGPAPRSQRPLNGHKFDADWICTSLGTKEMPAGASRRTPTSHRRSYRFGSPAARAPAFSRYETYVRIVVDDLGPCPTQKQCSPLRGRAGLNRTNHDESRERRGPAPAADTNCDIRLDLPLVDPRLRRPWSSLRSESGPLDSRRTCNCKLWVRLLAVLSIANSPAVKESMGDSNDPDL
jgi:hypothetical protein